MIRKKNKFWTFLFSAMFGAGHMYMGFMKQGISIMSIAAIIIAAGSFLESGIIFLVLPILWFYSFFDAMNKASLPDDVFLRLEDHYLFVTVKEGPEIMGVIKKYNRQIAVGLIFIGGFALLDEFADFAVAILSDTNHTRILYLLEQIRWSGARLLFSLVIIIIGIRLIIGKKKELDTQMAINQSGNYDAALSSFPVTKEIEEITMEEKEAKDRI